MNMQKYINRIDAVIDAAMTVQAEQGPDPDYRKWAEQDLEREKNRLLRMIERAVTVRRTRK